MPHAQSTGTKVAPTQGKQKKEGDDSCCVDKIQERRAARSFFQQCTCRNIYKQGCAKLLQHIPFKATPDIPFKATPDSGRHTRRTKSPQHTMVQRCNCSSNRPQQKTAKAVLTKTRLLHRHETYITSCSQWMPCGGMFHRPHPLIWPAQARKYLRT